MSITVQKQSHPSWQDGVVLKDGRVELVVTADVGPNLVHCSLDGKPNLFRVFGRDVAPYADTQWRPYGGHRLWHAPETWERTYMRDDFPPSITLRADGLDAQQAVEEATGMQKTISVTLLPDSSIKLTHVWRNCGVWPVQTAAWAISVMDAGGLLWVPQPRNEVALLPDRTVTLWPYTRMSDPRITWGAHSILLRQDPSAASPAKFGMSLDEGIMAYFNHGQMLVNEIALRKDAVYPDMGCMMESYTNADILEMETLSPLVTLGVGECVTHTELWRLFPCAAIPASEDEAEAAVRSALAK